MAEQYEAEMPGWAIASWRLHDGAPPSGGTGLSAARIVAAAIELADEEGLAALSIRKLGQRLGAGTMAAYRHIESRDELVILMVDVALGAPDAAIVTDASWRGGIERWAAGMHGRYRAHSWLIDAPLRTVPATPNRALWLEYILQVLHASGLTTNQALETALLVDGHARQSAYLAREIAATARNPQAASLGWLADILDPAVYPRLRGVVAAGELEDGTTKTLDFGLASIIAGIEALTSTR